jgi:hypothetical protein
VADGPQVNWPLPDVAGAVAAGVGVVAAGGGVAACTVTGTFLGRISGLVAWCVGNRMGAAVLVGVVTAMLEALPACLAVPLVLAIPPMTMTSAARLPSTTGTLLRRGQDFRVGRG